MAVYATKSQVKEVLRRDGNSVDGNASSIPDAALDQHIEDASSEIDAKLAGQYTTPFDPVPELIERICVAIAAYLAYLTFLENRDLQSEFDPNYLRYRRAQEMLTGLMTGSMVIPPVGEVPEPGTGTRVVSTLTRGSLITSCDFDLEMQRPCSPDYTTPEGWAIH